MFVLLFCIHTLLSYTFIFLYYYCNFVHNSEPSFSFFVAVGLLGSWLNRCYVCGPTAHPDSDYFVTLSLAVSRSFFVYSTPNTTWCGDLSLTFRFSMFFVFVFGLPLLYHCLGYHQVHAITRQAMAKLRKGCLPQERSKIVTYLSRYEPETLTGNNSADSRRWGDKNKDAEGEEDRERAVDHEEAVEVQEKEEKEEEEEGEEERDLDDDDPNKTWDFSSHGREELQHELARYLSRNGLDRQGEEAEDSVGGGSGRDCRPAKQSTTASASKPKGWSKGVRAQDRPRRAGEGDPAAAAAESGSIKAGERCKSREGGDGKAKIWSKDVLAKVTKVRKGSHSGPSEAPASIGNVKPEPRLQLQARERERELEKEEERLRSLPIPIGDGAGSAVIGGLEPLPNSREEDQLKHLSRLLWDGEEEPADFALTYGSRPRTSLQ